MSIALLLGTGFVLGSLHAFEPDHLAAVSSFVSKQKKATGIHGLVWGLGHTTSLLIATLLVLLLKLTFPSWFFELLVGAVLIILGVRLLLKRSLGHAKHQFAVGLLHGLAGT
ncbi:MAG: hypothetical protein KC535_05150, partial [Nanoarchaeota archaeon]|nr:hypothetical protein [Nanoarchaeota archaeon]